MAEQPDHPASDHLVHEALGPSLTGVQAAATIGVGVNSLLVLGVLPVLLGALVDERRLSDAGIGQAAMIELLAMGLSTALVGVVLKPRRLKTIGVIASLALAAADLGSAHAAYLAIYLLRGAAGVAEGVLLWITIAMIARSVMPERWAGVFFTAQVVTQLLLAVAFALWVMPAFGAAGGFAALALCAVVGVVPALLCPSRLGDLNPGEAITGAPSARGWFALAATLIFVSAGGAVAVYLQPLAYQAGLDAGAARTALWVSLAAQVVGGMAATALAGRVRYFTIFLVTSAVYLVVWWVFSLQQPAWLFIGANALAGFAGLLLGPFLVPMTIDADPSRRAAVQSGGAQLLGGALGPLLASLMISDRDVHGVLWLGAGLMLMGLAGVAWLHFTNRPSLPRTP